VTVTGAGLPKVSAGGVEDPTALDDATADRHERQQHPEGLACCFNDTAAQERQLLLDVRTIAVDSKTLGKLAVRLTIINIAVYH